MAKREKKPPRLEPVMWLVTFSDLVTLLLTFFVLLLSMSSMDKSVLTRINPFQTDVAHMAPKGSGKVPSRINMVVDLLENPFDVMKKRNRIKDLLFPHDVLPPDIDRSTLMENLQVLVRPEGVALVLTDKLLFPEGGYEIPEPARAILSQVALMLWETSADVNIAGYTDDVPGATVDNYELSGLRALAVLQYFLEQGMRRPRFSVAGYGPYWPVADNSTPEGRAKNRRVEILVKTTRWMGRY